MRPIRDKAEAVRAYARQAKNKSLEIDAAEIRIRAENRLGKVRKELGNSKGAAVPGVGKRGRRARPRSGNPPTLAELGISKDLSARAAKSAEIPDEIFEEKVAEWRERVSEENERVTVNFLKMGEKRQKHTRGTFGTGENEWHTPAEYVELSGTEPRTEPTREES